MNKDLYREKGMASVFLVGLIFLLAVVFIGYYLYSQPGDSDVSTGAPVVELQEASEEVEIQEISNSSEVEDIEGELDETVLEDDEVDQEIEDLFSDSGSL